MSDAAEAPDFSGGGTRVTGGSLDFSYGGEKVDTPGAASEALAATGRFGRSANVEIAKVLGAPGDFFKWLGETVGFKKPYPGPFPTRESVQSGMARLRMAPPPGEEEEGYAASAGRVAGATAPTLLMPLGYAANQARLAATTAIDTARPIATRVLEMIGKPLLNAPKTTLAAENVAAATAGIGGEAAVQEGPEALSEPARRALGEFAGGFAPATAAKAPLGVAGVGYKASRSLLDRVRVGLTPERAAQRAEERMKEVGRGVDEAVSSVRTSEVDTLPEAGLTPAQKSADPGYLALERAVLDSSEKLKGVRDAQIEKANAAVHTAVREIAEPGAAAPLGERQTRDYLLDLLDARARAASHLAEQRVAALAPDSSREVINQVAREEMEAAYDAARLTEKQLWQAIPKTVRTGLESTHARYVKLVEETPIAQKGDIPKAARTYLDAASAEYIKPPTTVHELIGLRSELLQESRIAKAGGELNRGRIAGELADAIQDDLGSRAGSLKGPAGEAYRVAADFSRRLNERFTRGPIGSILGFEKTGEASIPSGSTLERALGAGGPGAREATDSMLRASFEFGDAPAMYRAIGDYYKDAFQRNVIVNGNVNAARAQTFLKRFEEPLTRFPELREDFERAVQLGTSVAPRRLIKETVESPTAGADMKRLMAEAKAGRTGLDAKGVRIGLVDYLLTGADTGTLDAAGMPILSGNLMMQKFNSPRVQAAMREALSKPEIERMRQTIETARRVEASINAGYPVDGIIASSSHSLLEVIARLWGAHTGRMIAKATGAGGTIQIPGIMSERARNLVKEHVPDAAMRLLVDAQFDEKLWMALVTRTTLPRAREEAGKRLNAWAADLARAAGGERDDEEGRR